MYDGTMIHLQEPQQQQIKNKISDSHLQNLQESNEIQIENGRYVYKGKSPEPQKSNEIQIQQPTAGQPKKVAIKITPIGRDPEFVKNQELFRQQINYNKKVSDRRIAGPNRENWNSYSNDLVEVEDGKYICKQCRCVFQQKRNLNRHIVTVHEKVNF